MVNIVKLMSKTFTADELADGMLANKLSFNNIQTIVSNAKMCEEEDQTFTIFYWGVAEE